MIQNNILFPEKSIDKNFKEIKKTLLDHCSKSAGKPECCDIYSLNIP